MQIKLQQIKVSDLVKGYENKQEEGVVGFDGKLDIRPAYQREFIYKGDQQEAVIETVLKGFPLNVIYWFKRAEDQYELLDGQQRTMSICEFICSNAFCITVDDRPLHYQNLTEDQKQKILDYELQVYVCEGSDSELLDWFKVINTAGEKLREQELRNAIYSGKWTTEIKRYFSKSNCVAYQIGKDYIKGTPIRQDYLETVIKWICQKQKVSSIDAYMAAHQHDKCDKELWPYFSKVINWVETTFPEYHKTMLGVEWGRLYNLYGDMPVNPVEIGKLVKQLLADEDVTDDKGIYEYVFDKKEKHLSIRSFTDRMKNVAYDRQDRKCAVCGKEFAISELEAHHIKPWAQGGATVAENCEMVCKECHHEKLHKKE